jgi:hypothetical protein
MFKWYQDAALCYVFLADVASDAIQDRGHTQFKKSRWFTRGWTLQELLAPVQVLFYKKDGTYYGSKSELQPQISEITGIETAYLDGTELANASVAKKMSWAAHRNTSRIEDIAYCLLGIFDVNMPMLYGEGKKAFRRLQEEIAKQSGDYSLFVWGLPDNTSDLICAEAIVLKSNLSPLMQERYKFTSGNLDVLSSKPLEPLPGLFADSPMEFSNCGRLVSMQHFEDSRTPPIFFNDGIRIALPLWSQPLTVTRQGKAPWMGIYLAILGCRFEGIHDAILGIVLQPWQDGKFYARCGSPVLIQLPVEQMDNSIIKSLEQEAVLVDIRPRKSQQLGTPAVVLKPPLRTGSISHSQNFDDVVADKETKWDSKDRVLLHSGRHGVLRAAFRCKRTGEPNVAVLLVLGLTTHKKDEVLENGLLLGSGSRPWIFCVTYTDINLIEGDNKDSRQEKTELLPVQENRLLDETLIKDLMNTDKAWQAKRWNDSHIFSMGSVSVIVELSLKRTVQSCGNVLFITIGTK